MEKVRTSTNSIIPSSELEPERYQIWVDDANKIVSFHEFEAFVLVAFLSRELFHSYLDGLISQRYRFQ